MATAIDKARWEMIEAGGRTVQSFGLNRLLGQIYTLLYLHPEPMNLDDIAAALSVSKASISIACRQLASWGAVQPVWQRGDRKDYYTAEKDFKSILNNGVLDSVRKKLESAERQINRSQALLDESDQDGTEAKFMKQRLKEAEQARRKISRLIDNPLLRKLL